MRARDTKPEQKQGSTDIKYARERRRIASLIGAVIVLFGALIALSYGMNPPSQFPIGQRVEIPFGTSLIESARILDQAHVVRSSFVLQVLLISQFTEEEVQAGTYQFDRPLSAFAVARAVMYGTNMAPLLRVTIPEGLRNEDIDAIVSKQLPHIEPGMFVGMTKGKEGYLFPDTYHVPETFTAEQLVALMEQTFREKIESLATSFDASSRSANDIIIMASILEGEGGSEESMKLIAGILWKRIDRGMRLQVDTSFAYLLEKSSEDITHADLKIKSPYNTYRYGGLPPTPLNNPGLQAIRAALSPTASPYLYYLTGTDGIFHYASTFEEHKKNKVLYLK